METDGLTDYDRIAERMGDVLAELMGNVHEPSSDGGDSVTVTKDGLLRTVIRLQRLRDWGAEATVRLREQLDELAKASELTTAALAEFGIVLDGLEWDE